MLFQDNLKLKLVLDFCLILLSNTSFSQRLNWAISGGASGYERLNAIKIDASGDIYVTGFFENSIDVDPTVNQVLISSNGSTDIFTCKYSSTGNLIWSAAQGGSGADYALDIAIDDIGNTYVLGEFRDSADFDPSPTNFFLNSNGSADIFLSKISPTGAMLWTVSIGGSGVDRGIGLEFNPLGFIHITGVFAGTVDFDPSPRGIDIHTGAAGENIFISSFDLNGNFLWANSYVSTNSNNQYERGYEVEVDQNFDIVFTGSFSGTVDFDPSPTSTLNLTTSTSEESGFLSKLTPSGGLIWAKSNNSLGGRSSSISSCIEIDNLNNIYIGGFFYGNVDFDPDPAIINSKTSNGSRDMFISRFNSSGLLKWTTATGGVSSDVVANIAVDPDGFVYATGYFYANLDADPSPTNTAMLIHSGDADAYFWELDTSGNYISSYRIGSTGYDVATGITSDNRKDIFIAGGFSNTVDFDPLNGVFNLPSNGGRDFFIQQVNICKKTLSSINGYGCLSYQAPSGNIINTSGTYQDTIMNQNGCDSVITINLNLNQLDTTVIASTFTLSSNAIGTNYQWMSCINGVYSPINGATSKTYTPISNGSYAVAISRQNCRDTSACYPIISVGEKKISLDSKVSIYPNPFKNSFIVSSEDNSYQRIEILDINGKIVAEYSIKEGDNPIDFKQANGVYFIKFIASDGKIEMKKIVNSNY